MQMIVVKSVVTFTSWKRTANTKERTQVANVTIKHKGKRASHTIINTKESAQVTKETVKHKGK